MDSVLKEALVVKEGEELFVPKEECEPFCVEPAAESKPAAPEVTAH
jgi:hypothetical protein